MSTLTLSITLKSVSITLILLVWSPNTIYCSFLPCDSSILNSAHEQYPFIPLFCVSEEYTGIFPPSKSFADNLCCTGNGLNIFSIFTLRF